MDFWVQGTNLLRHLVNIAKLLFIEFVTLCIILLPAILKNTHFIMCVSNKNSH